MERLFTGKPVLFSDLKNKKKFEKDYVVCIFFEYKFVEMAKVVDEKEITKEFLDENLAVFAKPLFVLQPIKV